MKPDEVLGKMELDEVRGGERIRLEERGRTGDGKRGAETVFRV